MRHYTQTQSFSIYFKTWNTVTETKKSQRNEWDWTDAPLRLQTVNNWKPAKTTSVEEFHYQQISPMIKDCNHGFDQSVQLRSSRKCTVRGWRWRRLLKELCNIRDHSSTHTHTHRNYTLFHPIVSYNSAANVVCFSPLLNLNFFYTRTQLSPHYELYMICFLLSNQMVKGWLNIITPIPCLHYD